MPNAGTYGTKFIAAFNIIIMLNLAGFLNQSIGKC